MENETAKQNNLLININGTYSYIFIHIPQIIYGSMGWQTYSVVNADAKQEMCGHTINLVENLPKQIEHGCNLPKSACLGVLGIPGITAYIALTHVCQAKAGENIVISSAAGQIGHLVGQIAKILGLNVIGKIP